MEVHHHPDLHHKKKNFKEYFLEFLMIFLAVTLGFFAESLREHLVNVKKETEYIISVKEDLLTDTSSLSHLIPKAQLQLDKLDSLCILLNLAANKNTYDIHRLYYLNFRYSFGLILFDQNERTISQIKSTGAFNLIENKECKDSITFYYNFYDFHIQHEAVDVENWMLDLNKMSQTIFDYSLIKRFGFRGGADIFLNDSLPLKLISSDSIVLKEYMNKVRSLMMMLDSHLSLETSQFDNARKLIRLLNKEYHLQ
ncbi:MAG: hypothetical protein KGM16_14520 [Bacteroidota bacterium]|nr:hypothetical protein [Bacteroidota bacterium]